MADKTNLDCQIPKAAVDEIGEDALRGQTNRLEETPTKKRTLVHLGMYITALMLLFIFLMMCRSRRRQGKNLGSKVLADNGALQRLHRFPCRAN